MDFHPKEVVWAKVKGYPWWPAYVIINISRSTNYLKTQTAISR
jgi:hypothetical protein